MKERIFSLDFVKAVAIVAVVVGHLDSPFGTFIFSWHMPAFFFVSGALIYVKDRDTIHRISWFSRKDFFYLGKFYIVFGLLGIVAEYFKTILLHRTVLDIPNALVGLAFFMDMGHLHHYGFILWFLPALFWAKIFVRIGRALPHLWMGIFLGCAFYGIAIYGFPVTCLGIRGGMLGAIWGLTGYVSWKYHQLIYKFLLNKIYLGVILSFVIAYKVPRLDLANYIVPMPIMNYLYSLCVIVLLLMLARRLVKYNELGCWGIEYLSRNSIYIMALHVYTNNIVDLFVNHYLYGLWWIKVCGSIVLVISLLNLFRWSRKRCLLILKI